MRGRCGYTETEEELYPKGACPFPAKVLPSPLKKILLSRLCHKSGCYRFPEP
uniref:Uncharacterized protein n=1 Tax=Utricularia reniformis TaxID=192314 RepID=A0A1Y0B4B5_9LAMI|nr:hypothetical protein AEK19_MT2071 [Utricularia reniformis]ART32227.1 hypothetical protein AEK19_MT2071 [Utricularia reniformis]